MADKAAAFKQLLELTEQMYQAAQNEQWASIAELHIKRIPLIEKVFPLESHEQHPALIPPMEKLVQLNEQVEAICKDARQSLQLELAGMNKNKKAVSAYQTI
jgi:ferritin-like metal-binding protein YciE